MTPPPPTRRRILLSSPDVGQREEQLVVEAVRSGWIAPLGPMVDAFEQAIAQRCGRRHAVALSSGTAALHLALLEAGACSVVLRGRGQVQKRSSVQPHAYRASSRRSRDQGRPAR
jgi:dTDP-4-amino-4,6-dideoxygalactose transaminase